MERRYHIIGACTGWGAQIRACEKGPEALTDVYERLKQTGAKIEGIEMLHPERQAAHLNFPISQTLPLVNAFNHKLMGVMRKALSQKLFPIVIGGDHSIAVGTWSSFHSPFGLLWIDAHMDSHTPATSPSGAYHGMPLAALLGRGDMYHSNVLKPQNVALIGIRSYESGEANLLKELNVRIYFMDEVKKRGLKAIMPEALAHITKGVQHFGVSLDLDALDPTETPGVGSPEPGGLHKQDLLPWLRVLGQDPRLLAFEMTEFNPERDVKDKTKQCAFEVLKEVMHP